MIDDDDECGAVGGIRINGRNRNTWRKPAPMPLWHGLGDVKVA
jgi:hypothetical protein